MNGSAGVVIIVPFIINPNEGDLKKYTYSVEFRVLWIEVETKISIRNELIMRNCVQNCGEHWIGNEQYSIIISMQVGIQCV